MALRIETFSNAHGGDCFFKAIGHPHVAAAAGALIAGLEAAGPVALYDPYGLAEGFAEIHPLDGVALAGVYVQDLGQIGRTILGHAAEPLTDMGSSGAGAVFVMAFDAERPTQHAMRHLPAGVPVLSLDAMRLPDNMLTNRRRYLDAMNFATNFAFFRDEGDHHTRLVTANYWANYRASSDGLRATLCLRLLGADGAVLADWREPLSDTASSIAVDSRAVRARFGLGAFTGQLFLHVVGAAGHDVVKYALDTYGDDGTVLSCTHDANAWPADYYAGLPAPGPGETVVLWVQNSHPCPIPPGEIGLALMGAPAVRTLDEEIGPFATRALNVAALVPEACWPAQLEVHAGKRFVRPRYEVTHDRGRSRIAHVNVERTDLAPDPRIPELSNLMGKGYILPAPILPPADYATTALPTPMARSQASLPLAILAYDASGREVERRPLGLLARDGITAYGIDDILDRAGGLESGYGHLELVYDFAGGGEADGWLHGLFRYEDRRSGHAAETSFGAHVFNTALTYRGEPQSYTGVAPGLSTRLFLRLGLAPLETLCHLIYPASTPWHEHSATELVLHDANGQVVATERLAIPCSGSRLWRYGELFDGPARRAAGESGYVVIRDATCRLFGYHGLSTGEGAFSLDHMFGF
jgi:hypothetical protein